MESSNSVCDVYTCGVFVSLAHWSLKYIINASSKPDDPLDQDASAIALGVYTYTL